MHRRWLSLPLLSSCASAFYPYLESGYEGEGSDHSHQARRTLQDGRVTLDLHRVEKRANNFNILLSNKPSAPNALAIDEDGSDYSYFSSVNFGSKAQPMYMLIDTGSANTWVFSSECQSPTCSLHNTFGPDDSTTLETTSTAWQLAYGTGEVSGTVGTDTVAFANFSLTMSFGMATNASNDFNNYPMDGILGLGRSASEVLGVPTVMQVLANQAEISENVIGVKLNRASDNTKDGEIMFGGIDTNKFSGEISYTRTMANSSWEIPVMDAIVSNIPCNFTGKGAVIDTGTSYILMPPADAKTVHALIPGSATSPSNSEQYTIPCNTNVNLQIKISDNLYSISPKDYVGKSNGNVCNSNIIGHQAFGVNDWILGDVFLKNVYSVFDFDHGTVGFGVLGTGGTTATSGGSQSASTTSSNTSPSSTSSRSGHASGTKSTNSGSASRKIPASSYPAFLVKFFSPFALILSVFLAI